MHMVGRASGILVLLLAAGFVLPASMEAQIRLSRMTLGDMERAVRIGAMIYEATRDTRRASRTSPRPPSGGDSRTAGTGRTGGAGSARAGMRAVATGDDYLGVRYKWGGNTPSEGFDCSGFVKYVYARNGVGLPRTSRQQSTVGDWVPASVASLREGDLMFFASDGQRIDHVAMYAGGNRILHSSSSGGGVRYDDLDSRRGRWFVNHFVGARRVADERGSRVDAFAAARLAFDFFDPPDLAPRR
jgi:cell wall-associated NlpC family hydrolase